MTTDKILLTKKQFADMYQSMTVQEVAQALNISITHVYRLRLKYNVPRKGYRKKVAISNSK